MARSKRQRSAAAAATAPAEAASVVENGSCVVNFADDSLPPPSRILRTLSVHQGESSRKNGAEEQNLTSVVSGTQDPCAGMRINSPTPTSPSSSPNTMDTPDQEQVSKKKKRGQTTMKKFENMPRLEVQFNERGQPIGPNSVHLSTLLGYIGRKMVPITKEKWSLVRSKERDNLWSAVQEKFIIPNVHRMFVMMKIRQLWNTWKARTTKVLKEAAECGATEDYIDSKVKPSEVSDQEWMIFRRQRSSPQFIEKSKRFQELRAKQKLPHTLSRKGYARLEEEMKNATTGQSDISRTDLWVRGHTKQDGRPSNDAVAETMEVMQEFQGGSSSSTYSISKDPVAQVFGAEHPGSVRGLGFGATPSKVGATVSNTGLVTQLQRQVDDLRSQYDRLANDLLDGQNKDQQRTNETEASIFQAQQSNSFDQCGMKCKLLDWTGSSKLVAKGKVANTNPTYKVDDVPIGPGAWMIWVSRVLEPSAFLWRTRNDAKTLRKALGDTVAWPIEYIEMEDM